VFLLGATDWIGVGEQRGQIEPRITFAAGFQINHPGDLAAIDPMLAP
jgi:hypothetical protein